MRGVYVSFSWPFGSPLGSSPRAWGLCSWHTRDDLSYRFISTCVGFMLSRSGRRDRFPVHPHVRGVYASSMAAWSASIGSSPRAWGLCFVHGRLECLYRFIHTCVGFMMGAIMVCIRTTVHPHVRGVYVCVKATAFPPLGSSPRAWGLFGILSYPRGTERFIPTCVGFML